MDEEKPIKTPDEPRGPRLTDRQRGIMEFLDKAVPGSGSIFYGVLYALSQENNPQHIIQAAHSARELLKELARAFPGIPADVSKANAINKLRELVEFFNANPTDKELREKIKEIGEYLRLVDIELRQRYEKFLSAMDPGHRPDNITKAKAAAEFLIIERWLSAVAHRGKYASAKEL